MQISGVYILVKESITVSNTTAAGPEPDVRNKKVLYQNCALFTYCIREIINTGIHHPNQIDGLMQMYKLIEYRDNYLQTFGSLWQYYRNKLALNDNGVTIDFSDDTDSSLFNLKQKVGNRSNRKRWNKRFSNNVAVKIFK